MSFRSSVVAIAPNGLGLGEVAEFIVQKFSFAVKLNRITGVECYSSSPNFRQTPVISSSFFGRQNY